MGNQVVLVTGGTGFVGAALVAELQARGYMVWVLTRDKARAHRILGGRVQLVSSLADASNVDFGAIINLAGKPMMESRWNSAVKEALRASRLGLTRQLFTWCKARAKFPQVLINASAVGFYGDRGDELITEMVPGGTDFAAQLCADWEREALMFKAEGVRVCILRLGIVLGRDGGALKQMLPAFRLGLGGPMGLGAQYMSWVHRRDLLRMIMFCLSKELVGVFNAVTPEPCTNKEFATMLGAALHRPAVLSMPTWVLRGLFGEAASALLLASQRVIPAQMVQAGFECEFPHLPGALADLLESDPSG